MKVSFICPVRDKAPYVHETVRSILNQTWSPMEIVISDQGSTDGSREIVADLMATYDGPNEVRLLSCEDTDYRGMVGLNRHLNFIDTQIQGDIVIMCSADDWNHPERAEKTVRAFEEFNPSYVNTGVRYEDGDGNLAAWTNFPNKASRWLAPAETIVHQIGSNGSSAWARDLFQKYGPLRDCEQQDMVLPLMALFERGIYYVDETLHTYVSRASVDNAGIFGQIAAAKDAVKNNQLIEINNFMHTFNWTSIVGRLQSDPEMMERVMAAPGAFAALMEKISYSAFSWAYVRNDMIMNRVGAIGLNV